MAKATAKRGKVKCDTIAKILSDGVGGVYRLTLQSVPKWSFRMERLTPTRPAPRRGKK